MEIEIWKDIEGWKGFYQASSWGNLKSVDRLDNRGYKRKGCILKQVTNKKTGYKYVSFCKNGIARNYQVNILVACTFIGNCPINMEVNHKDGNKANNHADNLEYMTHQKNIQHAHQNGLCKPAKGENSGRAKLTEKKVQEIRIAWSEGINQKILAKQYNVHVTTIGSIVHHKNWKHI